MAEAVALYRGDFLEGFTLPDSPNFDDWQLFEAESLRQELALALERLAREHGARDEHQAAIPYARRWVTLDPWHEPAHQCLMQLYARDGQRAAALRQYQECVRILDRELGLPPGPETTALYESIRREAESRGETIQPIVTEKQPGDELEAISVGKPAPADVTQPPRARRRPILIEGFLPSGKRTLPSSLDGRPTRSGSPARCGFAPWWRSSAPHAAANHRRSAMACCPT